MSLTELTQSLPTGPRITAPAPRRRGENETESAESPGYLSVQTLRKKRNDYLTNKVQEIEEQREGRLYYHCAQWTAAEIELLRKRRQPVVTYNLVGPKLNTICGLIDRQRQDPKAYPRKRQGENGAELATAIVRYVMDANEWRTLRSQSLLTCAFAAISGVEFKLIEGDHDDPDIGMAIVDSENFFYHVPCYRPDFSDARGMGLAKWMEEDEAIDLFPDKEELIRSLVSSGGGAEFNINQNGRENRFAWLSGNRLLLIEHWYKHKGRWCWAFYVGDTLLDEGESPFFDARNKSIPRFRMWSANVDQDGDRYSFVRNLKGPQDEVNQRRSKALWTSVSRQAYVEKGAVDDIEVMRRELMRPDGIVEHNPGKKPEKVDQTGDMVAQIQFFQDAITYIQNFANLDAVALTGVSKNLSGRAINMLQQPGMAQLAPFITNYRAWQLGVYRDSWCIAQRNFTSEREIRITDNEKAIEFLQINGMELDEWGLPVIVNALGNLDVDIVLDEGPDVVNMQADIFDQIAPDPNVPFLVKLKFMAIPASMKQEIETMLQPPQPNPADMAAKQIALAAAAADVAVRHSTAMKNRAGAVQSVATAAAQGAKAALDTASIWQVGVEDSPLQPANQDQQGGGQAPPQPGGPVAAMPPAPTGLATPPGQPGVGPHLGAPQGGQSLVPPHLGARVAPDGKMYVPDPQRPGKYLMVA